MQKQEMMDAPNDTTLVQSEMRQESKKWPCLRLQKIKS